MAWSKVRETSATGGGANPAVTWTAPAAGNLIFVAECGDGSISNSGNLTVGNGWTLIGPFINLCEVNLWWKVAAGTETGTGTMTQSAGGTTGWALYYAEWSGNATSSVVDASAGVNSTGAAANPVTGAAVTTGAGTSDLVIGIIGDDGTPPAAFSAANGFTDDIANIATTAKNGILSVAHVVGAAASTLITAKWANAATPANDSAITVAFKIAAGGAAPALPLPIAHQRRTYLPAQRAWARGRTYNLVPAQVPVPVKVADQTSQAARRRQFTLARRGRTFTPVPAPQAPVAPPIVLNPTQRRTLRGWPQGRGRAAQVVPPQVPVPPRKPDDPTQRRAVRGWLRVKGRYADPPWGQAPVAPNPPIVLNPSQRKTVRGWLRVKGRYVDPPWPPPVVVPNPAITFNPSQRRVLRGWPQGRGRQVTPVPPQVPVPPRKPDDPTQRRSLRGWLRIRPKHWAPPWPQAAQPPVQDLVIQLGETVRRWSVAQSLDRWFTADSTPRWAVREAQSRWIITRPAGGLSMAQTISTASLEYVRVPVTVTKSGAAYNPTGDTVQMTFVSSARSPNAGDTWYAGSWETAGSTYYALCLVGPGGTVVLTAGTWYVWVKVTDAPEVPALPAGVIVVQ